MTYLAGLGLIVLLSLSTAYHMAYCRYSDDSDAYLYRSGDKLVMTLHPDPEWSHGHRFATRSAALRGVLAAREDGHAIPQEVIDRLRREIEQYGIDLATPAPQEANYNGRALPLPT